MAITIPGFRVPDPDLLWCLPKVACELPPRMKVRHLAKDGTWFDYDTGESGAHFTPGVEWNVELKNQTLVASISATLIGFPRPYESTSTPTDPRLCDFCRHDLSGFGTPTWRRMVGGVCYISCEGHDVGDADFLAEALELRSDEDRFVRCLKRAETAPGTIPWSVFGTAVTTERAAAKEQEANDAATKKREALDATRLAKVARLGDMLRAPMAPRFQTQETDWRRR